MIIYQGGKKKEEKYRGKSIGAQNLPRFNAQNKTHTQNLLKVTMDPQLAQGQIYSGRNTLMITEKSPQSIATD